MVNEFKNEKLQETLIVFNREKQIQHLEICWMRLFRLIF